jgi:hypothetical protein
MPISTLPSESIYLGMKKYVMVSLSQRIEQTPKPLVTYFCVLLLVSALQFATNL